MVYLKALASNTLIINKQKTIIISFDKLIKNNRQFLWGKINFKQNTAGIHLQNVHRCTEPERSLKFPQQCYKGCKLEWS